MASYRPLIVNPVANQIQELASGDSLTLALTQLNGGQLAGMRNRIINGDMRTNQYYNGIITFFPVGSPFLDRWRTFCTGGGLTFQQVSLSGQALDTALQLTNGASNTSVYIEQRIESRNSSDLAGQTVTISYYASSSSGLTLTWSAGYASATDNFTTSTVSNTGTQATTSTLTRYSHTFTLSASATTGTYIRFFLPSGLPSGSGTFVITGVQLEIGSDTTPFERHSYAQDLMLCQRYYRKVAYYGGAYTGTNICYFSPEGIDDFRANPIITPYTYDFQFYNNTNWVNQSTSASFSIYTAPLGFSSVRVIQVNGLTGNGTLATPTSAAFVGSLSAEL
jgi:hypothetical protein